MNTIAVYVVLGSVLVLCDVCVLGTFVHCHNFRGSRLHIISDRQNGFTFKAFLRGVHSARVGTWGRYPVLFK